MPKRIKIGIVICDRYRDCAGGKCFRALKNREGAFSAYRDQEVEIVGYTSCGGCPGGNVEYAPVEMKKNGVEVIHFATGLIVGYPPCPYIQDFRKYIGSKFQIEVIIGTHPIPQNYYLIHTQIGTWEEPIWKELIQATITDERTRLAYD